MYFSFFYRLYKACIQTQENSIKYVLVIYYSCELNKKFLNTVLQTSSQYQESLPLTRLRSPTQLKIRSPSPNYPLSPLLLHSISLPNSMINSLLLPSHIGVSNLKHCSLDIISWIMSQVKSYALPSLTTPPLTSTEITRYSKTN